MKPLYWFGIILLFTALTLLFVYVIPADSPLSVVNYVFGFTFVATVPGYCLVNILFVGTKNKLDFAEEAVLSVALSFGLAGLSGLFLGLSPIGINLTSVRLTLAPMVVVLASLAYIRKVRATRASSVTT